MTVLQTPRLSIARDLLWLSGSQNLTVRQLVETLQQHVPDLQIQYIGCAHE